MRIDITADMKPLRKAFSDLQRKQVPFATTIALNALAQGVKQAEREALIATFDNPTPFTLNAFFVKPATKARPEAYVAAQEIRAAYLEPYVVGGSRYLGKKKGMLAPRGIKTNQYGNLTKGTMARLKGKPGVFIGSVTFRKSGKTVNGVWQRPAAGQRRQGGHGTKGNTRNIVGGVRTGLKLLIQFEDTTAVKKRLPFFEVARDYVRANAKREFTTAMRRALATAR